MIFDCEHVAWNCSRFFVMKPGDIITGTPPGVADVRPGTQARTNAA